jgi:predicted TIM-barrel fold metal-dependent hydrolase
MIDCHAHLLTKEIYPEELFYGRFDIPKALIEKITSGLESIDNKFLDFGELFLHVIDAHKLERFTNLVKAFLLSLDKQAELFVKIMRESGVDSACILGLDLPDWSEFNTPQEFDKIGLQIKLFSTLKIKYPQLKFFLPFDPRRNDKEKRVLNSLSQDYFSGVKVYPALGFSPDYFEPNITNAKSNLMDLYEIAEALGKPIISHCSRGGIHGPEIHLGDSAYFSKPDLWWTVLNDFPKLKICLAHGGGEGDFRSLAEQPKGWGIMLETALMEFENLFVDVAFHSGIVEDTSEYFADLRKIMGGPLAGQILFGSDWPLHWGGYSYSHLTSTFRDCCKQDMLEVFDCNASRFLNR